MSNVPERSQTHAHQTSSLDATRAASTSTPAPGPRATRLRDVYGQALEHTLSRLSDDNLSGCYPTVSSRAGPVLRQVQAQMVGKLGEKCRREFDSILEARAVVSRLNELDVLVTEAKARRDSGVDAPQVLPNTLPPDRIMRAHLSRTLSSHKSQLNARLQTSQAQNAVMYDTIRAQRAEIGELLARVEAAAADVKGANAALGPVADQLGLETREGHAAVLASRKETL
ncbi:kinetochore protein NNF1 [Geosmithia morbida]|uniref:Kinetochore protein NNF1 n=1 Tax=Geosmithia morbida TaxID=1094350 RepID=A0A9P4YRD6_9HYPO|nr:kinetochore protein NNF1 [Geosmithia morbida]KAF4121167.1 kinetochore protein NNF1 [Geosmithia morbida]